MTRPALGLMPIELFVMVVKCLDEEHCIETLASLAQTCRSFYYIINPYIWADINARHPLLLGWACRYGRLDMVRRMVEAGADIEQSLSWPMPDTSTTSKYFESACQSVVKPSELFSGLDTEEGRALRKQDVKAFARPIHLAIISGNLELVKYIIQTAPLWALLTQESERLCPCIFKGAPPSFNLTRSHTKLENIHLAICGGHVSIAKHLLHMHYVKSDEPTASYLEHEPIDEDGVRFMVERYTCSPAILAARTGLSGLVAWISGARKRYGIRHRFLPEDVDSQKLSAIWHAYLNGHWAVVDTLLQHGASVDEDLSQGFTPLVHASLFQRGEHLIELIKRGANVETAFISKPANSIFKLERAGYDARTNPYHGLRPIDICIVASAQGPCIDESRIGRKSNYRSYRSYRNLVAWQPPRDELFQLARRRNKTNDVVWRPLGKVAGRGEAQYQAAERNRRKMIQALINAGASLEGSPASLSKTPPLVAAAAEHLSEIVGDLLAHGAPVNGSDAKGVTAIVAAFGYEHCVCPFHTPSASTANDVQVDPDCRELKPCVELLLEHGAMVDPHRGDSALLRLTIPSRYRKQYLKNSREWKLAPNDKKTLARLLLEKGADPNRLVSMESQTPPKLVAIDPRGKWFVRDGSTASSPTALNWPWSPVQQAFLQRDQEVCLALVAAKSPSAEIAKWIFQVSFMSPNTEHRILLVSPALDVFATMPADSVTRALQDPVCLAWMLANARELLYHDSHAAPPTLDSSIMATRKHAIATTLQLNASLFKTKVDPQRWHKRYGTKSLMIGIVCLEEAILIGVPDIVRKLVRLPRSWIRPEALRLAIFMADGDSKKSYSILKTLLQNYRDSFHLDEGERNKDIASDLGLRRHQKCTHFSHRKFYGFGTIIETVGAGTGLPCRNPLLYAICLGNARVVDLMVAAYESGGAPGPAFDRFYLKEACIRLDHAVLASLLKCASIRAVCELKTGQSPLMFLITNVETLCHGLFTTEHGVNVAKSIGDCMSRAVNSMSSDVGMSERFAQIKLWRACIREFELAGVDFKRVMDGKTGKSAHYCIQEFRSYKGNDRFLLEVAKALLGN